MLGAGQVCHTVREIAALFASGLVAVGSFTSSSHTGFHTEVLIFTSGWRWAGYRLATFRGASLLGAHLRRLAGWILVAHCAV